MFQIKQESSRTSLEGHYDYNRDKEGIINPKSENNISDYGIVGKSGVVLRLPSTEASKSAKDLKTHSGFILRAGFKMPTRPTTVANANENSSSKLPELS
jgi:hypothetical protein